MSDKKEPNALPGLEEDAMKDIRALASTREGQELKKELAGIDPKKLLATFSKMDKETIQAKLKNANAESLKKALQNKSFLDKLK